MGQEGEILSVVKFTCNHCEEVHSHSFNPEGDLVEFGCDNPECWYAHRVLPRSAFKDRKTAEAFSRRTLPSVGPRYVLLTESYWILAYQYRKIEPLGVTRLTQLVEPETISYLLAGFSRTLDSVLTVIEPAGNDFQRIDAVGLERHRSDLCSRVRDHPEGAKRCNESICSIIKNQRKAKKPYFGKCWVGLQKYFVQILVEGKVAGVFVCGDMQRIEHRESQERPIRKGLNQVARELGVTVQALDEAAGFCQDEPRWWRSKFLDSTARPKTARPIKWHDHEQRRDRQELIEKCAGNLQSLAERAYQSERRSNDGQFIREIGALFATRNPFDAVHLEPSDINQDALWRHLSFVLRRITEFLEIEEAHYLVSSERTRRGEKSEGLVTKARSTPTTPVFAVDAERFQDLFAARRNAFWPRDEVRYPELPAIVELIEDTRAGKVSTAVFCPITLHEQGESCLVLLNRRHGSSGFSQVFGRCVRNIAREVSHHINYSLRTLGLEEERRRLSHYIDVTFHTLNQSMFGISTAMEGLEDVCDTDGFDEISILETVADMRKGVKELQTQSDSLYGYVNLAKSTYRFDMPFSLQQLISQQIEHFISAAQERGITFAYEIDASFPDVYWDEQHIALLLANLIHNGVKYSHNKKEIIVRATYYRVTDSVELEVNNFGHGIPIEENEQIFERGFRSSVKDNRRPIPGAGLGLFMVSEVVKKHGGTRSVSSIRAGKQHSMNEQINWESFNTTFTVTLPRKVP